MKNGGAVKVTRRKKKSWDDWVFDIACAAILIILVAAVIYPIYYILIASFSDPIYATIGKPLLYPKGINFEGYKMVLQEKRLWMGYGNTIFYTVVGTTIGVMICMMAGYAFSRKDLPGGSFLMKLYVFTMYFGGGMIPTFLVVKNLGLLDTRAVMIILGSVSVYNIIVIRATLQSSIPDELYEAALMDGCRNTKFFLQIVLPLSKAIIAVMVLYIAVGYWNSYMNGVLYLTDGQKYPLQMILNQILQSTNMGGKISAGDMGTTAELMKMQEENMKKVQLIKYGIIVVSSAPIICVYPFIQKYFIKGVMIGSVKG